MYGRRPHRAIARDATDDRRAPGPMRRSRLPARARHFRSCRSRRRAAICARTTQRVRSLSAAWRRAGPSSHPARSIPERVSKSDYIGLVQPRQPMRFASSILDPARESEALAATEKPCFACRTGSSMSAVGHDRRRRTPCPRHSPMMRATGGVSSAQRC